MISGLDHVQLAAPANCEEAARAFFDGLLGLSEIAKPESLRGRGGVWFALGDGQLHIGVQNDFQPATKAHPALRVTGGRPDLEQLAQRLAQAGATVDWDDDLAGVARFYTEDPWGNRLELTTPTIE